MFQLLMTMKFCQLLAPARMELARKSEEKTMERYLIFILITFTCLTLCMLGNYSPTLKKGGYTRFGLSVNLSGRHNFISTQYLENKLIEFHQILCMH